MPSIQVIANLISSPKVSEARNLKRKSVLGISEELQKLEFEYLDFSSKLRNELTWTDVESEKVL